MRDDRELDDLAADLQALTARGSRSRAALVPLADRGDWQTQVLALSALGQLARQQSGNGWRAAPVASLMAMVPGLRRHAASVGRHGRLISPSLLNGTAARTFIVRTAAALALGECRDPALASTLTRLLGDPFRPVRLAAAVALAGIGRAVTIGELDARHGEATPEQIADGASTVEWLERLVEAHASLFTNAAPLHGLGSAPLTGALTRWLTGPLAVYGHGGAAAEAERYEHEIDLAHQLAKPFSRHDRAESLRQLDAFVALVSHLPLPPGARVVDLGGGSGWVSELLARFGFRPVVVDVARALLQLSMRRLRTQGLGAHVVTADMTALPFATASIDAVIVIDALHHVDDLAAVLREARRILVPGGPLLVGEPGEGHAESAKSLAEGREHGVRESEVHPFTVGRLAADAGFDRVDVLPRVPASAVMRVSDLRRAMRTSPDAWTVHDQGTVASFDGLVLRSMLARPLMVLSAGRQPADSRAPAALRAAIRPSLQRQGTLVTGHIDVENTGDTLWLAGGTGHAGVVQIGLQLLDGDGRLIDRELERVPIPDVVPPGARRRVQVRTSLPDGDRPWRLKVDLVAEQVCWFEDRGSRPATVDLP